MAKGLKMGNRRFGLKFMHSSKGTSMFQRLGIQKQERWAKHDRDRSRAVMKKNGW